MSDDPRDPALFLNPGETLRWSGRPDPNAPLPRMVRLLRIFGWAMVAILAFFVLIGWANRAELDRAGGTILGILVGISGLVAIGFLIVAPMIYRAGRRHIRYGVTNREALTVQGRSAIEVIRRPVTQRPQIVAKGGHHTVYYAKAEMLNHTRAHGDALRKTTISVGFEGLDEAAAKAAADALDLARGKSKGQPTKSLEA